MAYRPEALIDHGAVQAIETKLADAHLCGTGAVLVIARDGTQAALVPLRCKQWRCPVCGPRMRWHWINRITEAKPQRMLTLTADTKLFADPSMAYQRMKKAFVSLVKMLRRMGRTLEYCATWEPTAAGYPHLHVLLKGSYLPQRVISTAWQTLGCGKVVDIRQVQSSASAAHYVAKYMTKTALTPNHLPKGMRLIMASRKFFPPVTKEKSCIIPGPTVSIFILQSAVSLLGELYARYSLIPTIPEGGRYIALTPIRGHLTELDIAEIQEAAPFGLPP